MEWFFVVLLVALTVAAIKVRRELNDPDSDWGRWFQERVRPKLQDVMMGIFLVTFLVWAGIYVTAPQEDRGKLGESMKALWESVVPPVETDTNAPSR